MLGYCLILTGIGLILVYPIIEVLEHIEEGIYYMADAQAQALADLTAAVSDIANAVAAAAAALSSVQPNDSAAIEAQVVLLTNASNALKAAVAPPAAVAPAAH